MSLTHSRSPEELCSGLEDSVDPEAKQKCLLCCREALQVADPPL